MRCQMEKSGKIAVWTIIVMLSVYGWAMAWQLPDTGQTTCYNAEKGVTITCPSAKTDAFYGQDASYTINPPSYEKIGDSIVKDNNTGLIWEVKTTANKDTTYTWTDAVKYADNLTLGGYSDWRLPTVEELFYIVHRDKNNPSIDTEYFPNTASGVYWTATEDVAVSNSAWNVDFDKGKVPGINGNGKDKPYYVRVVRYADDYKPPMKGFIADKEKQTVIDMATMLMWRQDSSKDMMTWQSALAYCVSLTVTDTGYDDWRLPNINELQTLKDYGKVNTATDPAAVFPDNLLGSYWSSTTRGDIAESFHKWYFSVAGGNTSYSGATTPMYAVAVRGPVVMKLFELKDAVAVLKLLAGFDVQVKYYDKDGDGKMGLAEIIAILQYVANAK